MIVTGKPTATAMYTRRLNWRRSLDVIGLLGMLGLMYGLFLLNAVLSFVLVCSMHVGLPAWAVMYAVGCVAIYVGMSNACRLQNDRKRTRLAKIANRLEQGKSDDLLKDMDKMVQAALSLGYSGVADHLSKKTYELAQVDPELRPKYLQCDIEATLCHLSTPAYHRSWWYRFWGFETTGTLQLTPHKLVFSSNKFDISINQCDIKAIERRRHPLWLTLLPVHYLELRFAEAGEERSIFLTPVIGKFDIWAEVNTTVDHWSGKLKAGLMKP